MLKIKRTGASEYGHYINALICGDAGAGKTLISSTFPNPLYASAEGGLMSIADKGIPYVDINSSAQLLEIAKNLRGSAADREKEFGFPVDTIVIDTIDEVQNILKRERTKGDVNTALTQKDWGWLAEKMKSIVVAFRDMDINFVMTCHVKLVTDSETGSAWYMPRLQGSFGEQLADYVDIAALIRGEMVADTSSGKIDRVQKRTLHTNPIPKFSWLKDRSGKLDKEFSINFEDDYQRMFDSIYGGLVLPETVELASVGEEEKPSLEDAPSVDRPLAARLTDRPAKKAAAPKLPTKKAAPRAGGIPETPEFEYKDAEGNVVMSRNELPEGVVPVSKGFDTNIYCVETGNEVESDMQADMSRIRYRAILCEEAMNSRQR